MTKNWDVSWTQDKVFVKQIGSEKRWAYELTLPPYCKNCGRSLVRGNICWDSDRHENLSMAEQVFQMGFYFPNAKLNLQDEDDILSQHILGLKDNVKYSEPIGTAMAMTIINNFKVLYEADVMVSIPSYNKNSNHSSQLCEVIIKHLFDILQISITFNNAIEKIKNIKLHTLPTRDDREEAVSGMFIRSPEISVMNKNVILIDDLLTTGDTKRECIKILKENGAKKVWVYVAAGNV